MGHWLGSSTYILSLTNELRGFLKYSRQWELRINKNWESKVTNKHSLKDKVGQDSNVQIVQKFRNLIVLIIGCYRWYISQ